MSKKNYAYMGNGHVKNSDTSRILFLQNHIYV